MTRTDRSSLFIEASRARIYAALLDPDALETWLPPSNMRGRIVDFDPSPGGGFRMELTYLDGSPGKSSKDTDVTEVGFLDLVSEERVVQEVVFVSDDPTFAGTMTMTWSLADSHEGTVVTIRADDVPPGISRADHEVGLSASLANLAAYVTDDHSH